MDNLVARIVKFSDPFEVKRLAEELIDILDTNDEMRKFYREELERLYNLGV